ncbi:Hypothetical predicted protein, partial [Pelobates cultripes]
EDYKEIAEDLRKEISNLGSRTEVLENKTDELCTAQNEIAEKIMKLEEDNKSMRSKLADKEDRSTRNKLW